MEEGEGRSRCFFFFIRFLSTFFGGPKEGFKVGVMNVKLGLEERRRYVLEAVSEELEVCVVIDSGLSRAGNEAMEQEVERAGLKWIGKGREGDRRVGGGRIYL